MGLVMARRMFLGMCAALWVWLLATPLLADNNGDEPRVGTESRAGQDAFVEDGVLRWPSGEEIALFGVNYNAPFAFTYRAINRVGSDPEAAILMDVNHLKRLGVDAYRVHLWDREISDQQGNLLENEHLRLFDFLMAELKKNDIKIIITAIGWWGSGYPEPDPAETGFSTQYTKPEMNQKRAAVDAQKKYIEQLLNHKNRYTGLAYKADPDVVAIELFNEPKHHGTPAESAAYIEELASAARATGLQKPIFYNISEQGDQQDFAAAVCETSIDGIGYQWYPAGIVRFASLAGNMLPAVQLYPDVFANTGNCKRKARMNYEFDAADIPSPVMYPAMARSFREAGFQWATMFSYDPAVTAHTNAEYNTHYLNLLYTPEKAISFLISGEVFRRMPRYQTTPQYPLNNAFLDVTLDHHQDLSLLNNQHQFFYTNTTQSQPKNLSSLRHIAGVGSSPVVGYEGSGAYFLDRIADGVWQLEVYPDLQRLEDPHLNSSLRREVGRLYRNERRFTLHLPDLGRNFYVQKVNERERQSRVKEGRFPVAPGIYLLSAKRVDPAKVYAAGTPDYFLPPPQSTAISVNHQPRRSLNLGDDLTLRAQIGSVGAPEAVELLVRYEGSFRFTTVSMEQEAGGWYRADLAQVDGLVRTGPLEYAIVVKHDNDTTTFPGGAQGSPRDWDFVKAGDYWRTTLRPAGTPVSLYEADKDRNSIIIPQSAHARYTYVPDADGLGIALRLEVPELQEGKLTPLVRLGLAKDADLAHRVLQGYDRVALQVRSLGQAEIISVGVLDEHGLAYSTDVEIGREWKRVSVPLNSLKSASTFMPRAYPTFAPATLDANAERLWPESADLTRIQGVQLGLSRATRSNARSPGPHGLEVAHIRLVKGQ